MRDAIKLWWHCASSIDLKHVWKLTMEHAFPNHDMFQVLVSPVSVPVLFVLLWYQQYNIQKIIASLEKLNALLKQVLDTSK